MRLVACALALLALTGCAHRAPERQTGSAPTSAVRDEQPWTKPGRYTTCGDFRSRMTPRQRSVLVADLLRRLRSKDVGRAVPAAVVVQGFETSIDRSCAAVPRTYGIESVARSVYLTQRAHWRQ